MGLVVVFEVSKKQMMDPCSALLMMLMLSLSRWLCPAFCCGSWTCSAFVVLPVCKITTTSLPLQKLTLLYRHDSKWFWPVSHDRDQRPQRPEEEDGCLLLFFGGKSRVSKIRDLKAGHESIFSFVLLPLASLLACCLLSFLLLFFLLMVEKE
jgi:hypothetical protein